MLSSIFQGNVEQKWTSKRHCNSNRSASR